MKDKNGREYAKLSQVKAGDILEIDNDFDCHAGGNRERNDRAEAAYAHRAEHAGVTGRIAAVVRFDQTWPAGLQGSGFGKVVDRVGHRPEQHVDA